MVAEKDKKWFLTGWGEDIELVEGIILNLKKLIDEEDIEIKC